ncbi:protein MLN51 homolog [Gastrolobium bilobum]|uniref:protein MLN51 homolog n=1 Tax=Gastrolobium bilobum TaxID=150636 RepID=UPI002AB0DC67|nr:protein MLN51 homolog [Gastrolobium bilobum]
MATAGEEDLEYESDPEEAKRSLTMRRRREASDDEEGEDEGECGGGGGGDGRDKSADRRLILSDESDGEGGVADYDDEEELEEEEDGVDQEEEEYEEELVGGEEVCEERGADEGGVNGAVVMVKDSDADVKTPLEESGNRDVEEKKESEPFAVPTAGAFYMHDDRFRDNAGARHRRMRGGRRLWESKDDRKWGHDKFEEITLQDRHYKEGRRTSNGNYRGRGKTRGIDRGGYVRGNRKGYDNRGNQTQVPKGVVRGRGPRRYEPTNKSSDATSQMQNKQSGKPLEKTSHVSSRRTLIPNSNSESDPLPANKQVFASNLNSASPPFYPSGSSNKEMNLTPKRDVQTGGTNRNIRTGVVDKGFLAQQNNTLHRGKNVVDSVGMDKLYIDESVTPSGGKPLNYLHMPPPGSSGVNSSQSIHPRASGRGGGAIPVQMNYQPAASHNQGNKIAQTQLQAVQRTSASGRTSTYMQTPGPQLGHRPGNGSQASSPQKTSAAISSLDSGEIDAASESGKSKGALVGKGRGSSQGSGRGSFVYGGAMGTAGNMGGSHGDQNFPAFLPVMQFGGQHPGGIGVPAVGMAFPGYVAQPQHGTGNSEMTWLPVLAGAAGALGASYCPPYFTVDGAYHTRQSGQASATATSSKENNVSKANNEWKPPERPEPVSDEFGQRQNKPRRYSEMNFGQ